MTYVVRGNTSKAVRVDSLVQYYAYWRLIGLPGFGKNISLYSLQYFGNVLYYIIYPFLNS